MTAPEFLGLRHLSRHLHATVQDALEDHLVACGWLSDGTQGFETVLGALPVIYERKRPDEFLLQSLKPNIVAISFGGQTDDATDQLGGGLVTQEHVFFVDVYAENDGIAVALAEDIRDYFVGRTSVGRYFRVIDQTTGQPDLRYLAEYTEVFREPADRELPSVRWQIIRGTVSLDAPGYGD